MIQPLLFAWSVAMMIFGAGTFNGWMFFGGVLAAAAMGLEAALQESRAVARQSSETEAR